MKTQSERMKTEVEFCAAHGQFDARGAGDGIQLAEWALISLGAEASSDTTPPAAPTGFTAAADNQVVVLDWADNTESDIARYTVHRSTTSGGPYTAIATGLMFSAYSDTSVTNGTTYHYVVTAIDRSLNDSVNSAEASGLPLEIPPPPAAPSSLTATAVASSRIDLAWNTGDGAIHYTVNRSTTSGGPYVPVATNVTTKSYSDTSASPRTTYYYVVRSVNSGGESGDSPEAWARFDGLLQHLKFDESAGTTAADSSGNGRNATLVNGPAFAPGRIGNALGFTASSSQYATLPAGLVSNLNDFTISVWVKPGTLGNWARVFDFGNGTATNMFLTTQNGANGKPRFAIKISNSAEQQIDAPDALAADVWTHIAVTLSGNTGTLYVNGVSVGTNNAMTFKPSAMGSTAQNYIGKSQYPDPYFNGAIDDFRIYSSALNASDIGILAGGELGVPQNVTAASGDSQIALSWNAVVGATGYTVQRSSNGGGPFTDLATEVAATTYLDSGLADGATWHYTITAHGLPGAGAPSSPVSATTYTSMEIWRFEHFNTIESNGIADDSADPDGDGWSNANEFAAGTDPNSAASLLGITGLVLAEQDVTIQFPTVAGRNYRVEKSATLSEVAWETLQDNIPGTGATIAITDPGARALPSNFYRIVVLP
jgi:fibronectin type 3 domain-containing protein